MAIGERLWQLWTNSLIKRIRRIALGTTVLGVSTQPLAQGAALENDAVSDSSTTAIILNRSKRSTPRLWFRAPGQSTLLGSMFAQHRSHSSHSSHSSHRSHYSGATGTVPAPRTAPSPSSSTLAPSLAVDKPGDTDLQKLTLEVVSLDKANKVLTGKDEFGTEYKIGYSLTTKFVTLGTSGSTKTLQEIVGGSPNVDFLRKGQDISVIWEKQGTKRVALKITVIE
jgi:hypothetical protein